jgi:NADPH:quinone reductase-like Zn-dependent oxidoreductase
MMKAIVQDKYGSPDDVLQLREIDKPVIGDNEVLVRVHATTVSRTDCGMLRAHPFFIRLGIGLLRPNCTILGMDFAGEVEAVGTQVTSFQPGERVFGVSPDKYGAHAEYLCMPAEGMIATMPSDLGFSEAVVGEGAWYADTYLKKFELKPGHKILIYGASGAIGTAAVQLAKFYGAKVTAVVATRHLDLAKSLGADHVVDYTTQDFTRIGETYDFVFDAVGKATYFRCRRLLTPGGIFAATDLGPWCQNPLLEIWYWITGSNRVVFPLPKSCKAFVEFLKARMEVDEFHAVIDRKYPLEAIADAYRYVETGQKTGIVIIYVTPVEQNRERKP